MARVLIADDDDIIRGMVRKVCQRDGHDVIDAVDGRSAIEALGGNPDLLILDLNMPGGGGAAVLEHLEQDPVAPACPVIVITGHLTALGSVARRSPRVSQLLEKPFAIDTLSASIRMALARRAT